MADLIHSIILTGEQVDEIWINAGLPYDKRFYLMFGTTNFLITLLESKFKEFNIELLSKNLETYKAKISFATESDLATFILTYM